AIQKLAALEVDIELVKPPGVDVNEGNRRGDYRSLPIRCAHLWRKARRTGKRSVGQRWLRIGRRGRHRGAERLPAWCWARPALPHLPLRRLAGLEHLSQGRRARH